MKLSALWIRWFSLPILSSFALLALHGEEGEEPRLSEGRELFLREWLPRDPRSHGGDGLGPVFNDSSCVACHNQGGPGGGGPAGKNIQIIAALPDNLAKAQRGSGQARNQAPDRSALIAFHPGFKSADAVVLHRFSTEAAYSRWIENKKLGAGSTEMLRLGKAPAPALKRSARGRQLSLRPINGRTIVLSERNPPALFGAGVIDAIPAEVIAAGASAEHPGFPEVKGRVARLKDGRVGRFGWKAQTASLEDFTRAACAVELGLEVPGHEQAGLPHRQGYRAPGLDLTAEEVGSLVAYLRSLPTPGRAGGSPSASTERGETLFSTAGCAACHLPDLGPVKRIYSDLLLHDMGDDSADAGSYGVFAPEVAGDRREKRTSSGKPAVKEALAGPRDWRTPPLWGARDSAPYLHDGRADTLEEAVLLHGGEAQRSTELFRRLSHRERGEIIAFLKSLTAPD
jgi:CxxC motif-containing protein (DUF1111 family)